MSCLVSALHREVLFVCFAFVFLVVGRALTAQTLSREDKEEISKTLRDVFIRDVDVAGTVVDDRGQALQGVLLHVMVHDRRGETNYERTLDGQFAVKHDDCLLVELRFSKPGYYGVTQRISSRTPTATRSPDGDALVGGKDMRIVLEEIGPATPMIRFEPNCQFRIGGEWRVTQLVAEKEGKRELLKSPLWYKLDMTGKGIDALPPYCPYLRADIQDGRVALADKWIRKAYPGGSADMDPATTPARVYLGVTGLGNGLLLFDPGGERKSSSDIEMRAMKEAPETGYTQEILLDQAEHEYAYFYLKIGDWYGKGYVALSVRSFPPTALSRGFVRLWVQPDGSRNVRSLGSLH